ITNLISIKHLDLLKQLYQIVVIPQSVYEELSASGKAAMQQVDQPWISIQSVINRAEIAAFQRKTRLDRGESEAILLTQQLGADLLLIDERRGRAEAQRLKLRITGLLGILVESKRRGFIAAVKPLMDQLIADSTFRVSPKLYKLILEMVQEQV
ncbi:MAG: DUF3368 domain-containing protein, partial [Cyanobacteria bacterium J06555_13]